MLATVITKVEVTDMCRSIVESFADPEELQVRPVPDSSDTLCEIRTRQVRATMDKLLRRVERADRRRRKEERAVERDVAAVMESLKHGVEIRYQAHQAHLMLIDVLSHQRAENRIKRFIVKHLPPVLTRARRRIEERKLKEARGHRYKLEVESLACHRC